METAAKELSMLKTTVWKVLRKLWLWTIPLR
jgi:hypothetical protein